MNTSTRARGLVTEVIVIVIGVLLALGAESWWTERRERAYESDLRDDVIVEFRENLAILLSDSANNVEPFRRVERLVDMDDVALLGLADSDFAHLAGRIDWQGFDPVMGSVQALVSSGALWAIEDRTLRIALSTWAGLLEEKRRFNLQATEFQQRAMYPVAARAGSDRVWSPEERRELQSLAGTSLQFLRLVERNQRALRAEARRVLDDLGADWSNVGPVSPEERVGGA